MLILKVDMKDRLGLETRDTRVAMYEFVLSVLRKSKYSDFGALKSSSHSRTIYLNFYSRSLVLSSSSTYDPDEVKIVKVSFSELLKIIQKN